MKTLPVSFAASSFRPASWQLVLLILLACAATNAVAEQPKDNGTWGHLSGQFLYDGPPPEREPLELNKDIEFCGPHKPLDEELIVHPKTRGLKNVILWLEPKADVALLVHPSYEKTAKDKVRLDNLKCQFEPHVCVLRTTQTLVIGNKDAIAHNVAAFFLSNDPFNVLVPLDQTVEKTLPKTERLPAQVTCPIHAWMKGWMVVKDHPYVAVSDENGRFELKNLPAGEWTFRVWHEKKGYVTKAARAGEPQQWAAGKLTLTIKPGENALGELRVKPAFFGN